MHRSVLQSKVYIKYADANTVEVISMEEMDKALAEKSRHARTYKLSDAYGDDVECLVEFPGLTVEQLDRLSNSPARDYMTGNRIPYTAVVNPHTLEEMVHLRGVVTPKELIESIKAERKKLDAAHGKGIERKLWREVQRGQIEIDLLLGEDEIAKAMAVYRHLAKRTLLQPEALKRPVETSLAVILDDAAKRLDVLERRIGKGEGPKLKEDLRVLSRALADTKLAARVRELEERARGKQKEK